MLEILFVVVPIGFGSFVSALYSNLFLVQQLSWKEESWLLHFNYIVDICVPGPFPKGAVGQSGVCDCDNS